MNIALIGYRGSGKSSIGRALARRLAMAFVDTDVLLVQRSGITIREIFDIEGEAGFRTRESAIIREVAAGDHQVIALGGGAILKPENMQALKADGRARVIWLQVPPEILYQRIQQDSATNANRPNLTSAGGLEEIRTLLAVRTPLYQAAADATCDISARSVEDAAAHLATLL